MAVREQGSVVTVKVAGREYWRMRNSLWRVGMLSDVIVVCTESECAMLDRIQQLENEKAAILADVHTAFADTLALVKRLEP